MALSAGTRLGHYDVTALIGEGGMGQVWQATDTQLGRQVALKILPDAFAVEPDRLARFQREAQVLASLNHPNIGGIYAISPDGRWVAYRLHETGESEVYVAPLPTLEGRQAVSVGGGWSPVWSRDGLELFYQAAGRLMVVPITTEPNLTLGTPEILFEGPYLSLFARTYDLAPDGRFLMVRPGAIETSDTDALTHVVLVQNWFEELKRLVPVP